VFLTELLNLLEVILVWDDYTTLSLDWLKKNGTDGWISLKDMLNGWDVIKGNEREPRSERTKVFISLKVITGTRSCDSSSPEISFHADYLSLIVRDLLDYVAPPASKFHCSLTSLGTGVHGQKFVIPHYLCKILTGQAHLIVVEST